MFETVVLMIALTFLALFAIIGAGAIAYQMLTDLSTLNSSGVVVVILMLLLAAGFIVTDFTLIIQEIQDGIVREISH